MTWLASSGIALALVVIELPFFIVWQHERMKMKV